MRHHLHWPVASELERTREPDQKDFQGGSAGAGEDCEQEVERNAE